MKSTGPSGGVAVLLTAAILAAVALAYAATGRVTCDPPRHVVAVQTADGFGRHECVSPAAAGTRP